MQSGSGFGQKLKLSAEPELTLQFSNLIGTQQWRTKGGVGGFGGLNPPRNSEVLTKSNRIAN